MPSGERAIGWLMRVSGGESGLRMSGCRSVGAARRATRASAEEAGRLVYRGCGGA